jgi:Na+/H+ antiporter NhaD/arsenite permease-like protein
VATLSIVFFIIIIGLSLYDEGVQPGMLAIAAGLLIALAIGEWSYSETIGFFPSSLFLTLSGILLFFGAAVANGTIGNIVQWILRSIPSKPALIPFVLSGAVVALTAVGVGNIGAIAILAPAAMAISHQLKLKPFLMILLLVGAANAGALSPLAVTGITINQLISSRSPQFAQLDLSAFGVKLFTLSFLIQSAVSIIGFFAFGGIKWMRGVQPISFASAAIDWTRDQKITMGCIAAFVLTLLVAALPIWEGPRWLQQWGGEVAAVAFAALSILLMLKTVDPPKMIATVPWGTILMVTGIVMYIEIASQAGAIEIITNAIVSTASKAILLPLIFAFSAVLSIFSSSSGVVLPLFVSLAPGLSGGGIAASDIVTGVAISAHLVDTSPLSSLGALCIAASQTHEKTPGLFRSLLAWAFLMVPLGALLSWLIAM